MLDHPGVEVRQHGKRCEALPPGAATFCVIQMDGTKIKAANVGDSGFRVVRAGKVVFASPALQHYFNCPYQLAFQALADDTDTAGARGGTHHAEPRHAIQRVVNPQGLMSSTE